MREKELRLALVCFGGISLAIYIHGVTKEILKLVRASKAYHFSPDLLAESRQRYIYPNDAITDTPDTELVYFDILKAFSPELDLRVIVDTIAGASAGGMNSIFLGRALAHDLNLDHLREHWLTEADVSRLVGRSKPPGRLDKLLSVPLINFLSRKYLGDEILREKVKEKLPALLKIWSLKPPFDGKHLLGLIYAGLDHMGTSGAHSLLPKGHRLDLFVTLTDYHGFRRNIPLHDPPIIHEREHRHHLRFSYFRGLLTTEMPVGFSDFEEKDLPALAFASRATACYPGAFPPAQLREVVQFLKERGEEWANKDNFIDKNFKEHLLSGLDPFKTSFLDGSILNNKPFDQVIEAIQGRPAFRKVDRRLVYVDPNPELPEIAPTGAPPSMLSTIKAALSDIPMNEPMHDDLMSIQALNQQVRIVKSVVDSIKPNVERLVKELSADRIEKITSPAEIAYWRSLANARAVKDAGFSYEGYARLKIRSCLTHLTRLIGDICACPPGSESRRQIYAILQCWAYQDKVDFTGLYGHLLREARSRKTLISWVRELLDFHPNGQDLPAWARFLIDFDISYHRRRLQFMIQELNTLYGQKQHAAKELDRLKSRFYEILQKMDRLKNRECLSEATADLIRRVFAQLLEYPFDDNPQNPDNLCSLAMSGPALSNALEALARDINLQQYRDATDQLIAEQNNSAWKDTVGHEMTINYLGFAFWDVITFSIMGAKKDLGEFNEVLINRISPNDNSVLKKHETEVVLRGTALRRFGAFFSRADRENDYFWGRLNGAERLIDLLAHQAKLENVDHKIDVRALKKRAFQAIFETEKDALVNIPNVLADLKNRIAAL
ncbi:patatin-like protein [Luteithermobacter gelatinilyticus]|uniref:patatin-like protein n=1 Tax=Luteithermobacter gelatinilyticus TaxID=2582913 RepID=UPI001106D39B|nr:patatin-like protein [Luteithermobacter gelatinilyticus]|tara:strand:- start:9583 stop:12093 length:2511 start_codon:yes stop_codon:yes gene_type:complete